MLEAACVLWKYTKWEGTGGVLWGCEIMNGAYGAGRGLGWGLQGYRELERLFGAVKGLELGFMGLHEDQEREVRLRVCKRYV